MSITVDLPLRRRRFTLAEGHETGFLGLFNPSTTIIADVCFILMACMLLIAAPLVLPRDDSQPPPPPPIVLPSAAQLERELAAARAANAGVQNDIEGLRAQLAALTAQRNPNQAQAPGSPTFHRINDKNPVFLVIRDGRFSFAQDPAYYQVTTGFLRGLSEQVQAVQYTPIRLGDPLAELDNPNSAVSRKLTGYVATKQWVLLLVDGAERSIEAFYEMLKRLDKLGLEFGWEPLNSNGIFTLSAPSRANPNAHPIGAQGKSQ